MPGVVYFTIDGIGTFFESVGTLPLNRLTRGQQKAAIKAALSQEQGTWGELFSRKLRRPLLIGIALAVLQQVTGINVFLYFGATIFKTMSATTGVDAGLLTQIVINGACVCSP